MTLKDLEQLQHEIVDRNTKVLVAEAVKAYEVGALRAATVSLWIAVVSDLTQKLRQLADTGDGRAAQMIDELDEAIEQGDVPTAQAYERNLIDKVTEHIGILGSRDRREISRLYDDRHLCAHPAYVSENELFVPDAEVVRAHLVASCRAVFSQQPLSGKRLIDTFQQEVRQASWPRDEEYFLERFFRHHQKSVQKNILKLCIKGSVDLAEEDEGNIWAKRCRQAVYAAEAESRAFFEETLEKVLVQWEQAGSLDDAKLIRAAGAFGRFSTFWHILPNTGKQRLVALVEKCDVDFLIRERFFVSGRPDRDGDLATLFDATLKNMDRTQLRSAIRQTKKRGPFISRAIELIQESGSFRTAEENVRLLQECSRDLEASHILDLHKAIEDNEHDQVLLAYDVENILISIYEESPNSEGHAENWKALVLWLQETTEGRGSLTNNYQGLRDVVGVEG